MHSTDEEEPAAKIVTTASGNKFDINNISGKKKTQLVLDGEATVDTFVAPDNMPGKKLKILRDTNRENLGLAIDSVTANIENTFKQGEMVVFKKAISEVLKVDPKRGVLIVLKNGSKAWVHHSKVKYAVDEKEE